MLIIIITVIGKAAIVWTSKEAYNTFYLINIDKIFIIPVFKCINIYFNKDKRHL